MSDRTVTLLNARDAHGSYYVGATLAADGSLTIESQDLGDIVEAVSGVGNREYECTWMLSKSSVAALVLAMGADGDVLELLVERFSGENARNLKTFLDNHSIVYESFMRLGD